MATPEEQHEIRNALVGCHLELKGITKALDRLHIHLVRIERALQEGKEGEDGTDRHPT